SSIAINDSVAGGEMLFSITKLAFFLIMWFAVGVFVLPSLLNNTRRFLNSETLLIISMGLCLGMAVFSVYCGFSLALGAFVMGSILAGTSFAERIEKVVTPVKDLFGSVFFISVGMMVNPSVISTYWAPILILSGVVIVGMILFGASGMLVTGQTLKVAIEAGFSLTQIGEFAFIIATLGMSLGVLDPTIYPIVVAVSVLTTFTTPYFIRMADPVYNGLVKILPKRLHFLIDRYCDRATNESETGLLWKSVLNRYLWRVMLYTVVLITISLISINWLLPWLVKFNPVWGKLICALVTIAAMGPFLLALSMPASKRTERQRLLAANAHFDVPLIVMTIFRMIVALIIVIFLLARIYSAWVGVVFGFIVFAILIFGFSKQLKKKMRGLESRFIDNLNERELRRSGKKNNIVSNLHMAYMTVGYDCPFVGERLQDSGIRQKCGVNIATIQRGATLIPVPSGDTRIFPGDVLGVIGTDDQIQQLLEIVEKDGEEATSVSPTDYKLTSLQLSESSPLVGKTVAESRLSTDYSTLLVSINRNEEFLTPAASTVFEPHDILWVVSTAKTIATLR
ncbi:MAG: cation:proton antiporter, partial [Paramuribaculum sp.]|nr:cation:proton antiporter [Paramuribaculum sp.]